MRDITNIAFQLQFNLPDFPVIDYHETGSRYICSPPVLTTDHDFVVLVPDLHIANAYMTRLPHWQACSAYPISKPGDLPFFAWRSIDNVNLILISDRIRYDRFCAATELAKFRNLTEKKDRVDLFHIVINGELPTQDTGNICDIQLAK